MPRCEYSYYATLLSCNKFYTEPQGGLELSQGAPWPVATP